MGEADVFDVPGAFELPLAACPWPRPGRYAGVACLGAVIRGETDHYDYVCAESARGIMDVQLRTGVPCAFGVLTVENMDQALARTGGGKRDQGAHAAEAVVTLARMNARWRRRPSPGPAAGKLAPAPALGRLLGLLEQRFDGAVLVVEALQPLLEHRDGFLRTAGREQRSAVVVHRVGAGIDLGGVAAGVDRCLEGGDARCRCPRPAGRCGPSPGARTGSRRAPAGVASGSGVDAWDGVLSAPWPWASAVGVSVGVAVGVSVGFGVAVGLVGLRRRGGRLASPWSASGGCSSPPRLASAIAPITATSAIAPSIASEAAPRERRRGPPPPRTAAAARCGPFPPPPPRPAAACCRVHARHTPRRRGRAGRRRGPPRRA